MIIYILIGIVGGFMSGFMGIGGGLVMVPLLVILSKFTQHMRCVMHHPHDVYVMTGVYACFQ